jgi:hypothetical protein
MIKVIEKKQSIYLIVGNEVAVTVPGGPDLVFSESRFRQLFQQL